MLTMTTERALKPEILGVLSPGPWALMATPGERTGACRASQRGADASAPIVTATGAV